MAGPGGGAALRWRRPRRSDASGAGLAPATPGSQPRGYALGRWSRRPALGSSRAGEGAPSSASFSCCCSAPAAAAWCAAGPRGRPWCWVRARGAAGGHGRRGGACVWRRGTWWCRLPLLSFPTSFPGREAAGGPGRAESPHGRCPRSPGCLAERPGCCGGRRRRARSIFSVILPRPQELRTQARVGEGTAAANPGLSVLLGRDGENKARLNTFLAR